MNLYDVIKKPVITEKSMIALEAGKYTFEVDTRAHKLLIKQAPGFAMYCLPRERRKIKMCV